MKKLCIGFLMAALAFLWIPSLNANGITYRTYTYSNTQKRIIATQDAYIPLSVDSDLGGETLNQPEDIYIDKDDNIYIADTGNKRIIKYDLQNEEVFIIGEGILNEPKGVHVGYDGNLYVADFGNKAGYQFIYDKNTKTYSLGVTYKKPVDTPYFSDSDVFEPTKIVTDKGNNVYLLLAANINGLAEFENSGTFFGFFGGNRLPNTWDNVIRSMFFDEQQRREWFKMIPKPVYNVAVDHNGLMITTTKGQSGYLKLNIANFVYSQSSWGFDDLEDVSVGPYNTIFTISQKGEILEYTEEGNLLFLFSGQDTLGQKGLFNRASGIAVDSKNNIYVVDRGYSNIQMFQPSRFANLIHKAIVYYQAGLYSQSKEPWEEVLKMNSLFDLANKGLGDAYFAEADYQKAMHYYEISRDIYGYSDAYWEVRNEALLSSAPIIVYFLIGMILFFIVNHFVPITKYARIPFSKTNKYLSKFTIYNELKHNVHVMKNPNDGYYGIKREKKASNISALIMLMLFFLMYLFYIYFTKFTFNNRIIAEISLVQQMIFIFAPFTLWVIGNYLVCSIRDGEGTLSNVFQGTVYALLPMTITFPILVLVSQFLTLNESFVFTTIWYIGLGLTGMYLVIMVKEIHFYDMKPTIGNILISIFTALMMLVMVMIVYILLSEVIGLFQDIFKEVINRA